VADWTFLSPHALVLLSIEARPDATMREIGDDVGRTERWVGKIVADLVEAGYVQRTPVGLGYHYTIDATQSLRHPLSRHATVRGLLGVLEGGHEHTEALVDTNRELRATIAKRDQTIRELQAARDQALNKLRRLADLAANAASRGPSRSTKSHDEQATP
jgi:DNA-binding Lrp family transcriptional regulator